MPYKNIEMEQMICELQKHLDRTDLIGYAAARNIRILRTEASEYLDRKEDLLQQYGKPELDDDGNPTGRVGIRIDDPEFEQFVKQISEWSLVEHEPKLFMIKYENAIGKLTGAQILAIDWMFED